MNLEDAKRHLRKALYSLQFTEDEYQGLEREGSASDVHRADVYIREALDALSRIKNP